ncbi:MAG: type II toxin-antitoxin system HicA family toxin [Candidatus Dormibacteraceae bacterium]
MSVTPAQLISAIEAFGFEQVRQSGSHAIYRHPSTGAKIAFAHRRPHLDAAYVKAAVGILKNHEGGE